VTSFSVLAVTNTYPTQNTPGDTPCIRDQIRALRARGIDVDLLHIERRNKRNYLRAAWRLAGPALRRRRYDLVHAYYGHCGLVARFQVQCPVVVTFRGSDLLSRRDGTIGRLVARLAEGVIVMTDEMKLAAGRPDARVIPFGVNTDIFHPVPREQAQRELGLPPDARRVLFPWDPSRPEKRFDLVEAALRCLGEMGTPARPIVIWDRPPSEVATYMNACDVLLLVSEHEGAPMAVREALACNLPVVSVDVGDVRRVIADAANCHICTHDPANIAAKLGEVFEQYTRSDGAERMHRMDVDWSADQVLGVYEMVLNRADEPAEQRRSLT
jgi:teichuronic acid biosynthesis glycosyltransferase TuaC